jgi:hypothetical protein
MPEDNVRRRGFLTTLFLPLIGLVRPVRVATFPDVPCFAGIKEGDIITVSGVPGYFRAHIVPAEDDHA